MTNDTQLPSRCASCRFLTPVYMGDGDELLSACVYILRTGRKRPCPAGEGCTVFETVKGEGYTGGPGAWAEICAGIRE